MKRWVAVSPRSGSAPGAKAPDGRAPDAPPKTAQEADEFLETGAGVPHSRAVGKPYAVAAAGSETCRGISVSRAMTRRWICEVPS